MTAAAPHLPLQRLTAAIRAWRTSVGLRDPVVAHEVRTPRLLLRPYRMSDEQCWRRIEDDESIRHGLDWPIRTTHDVASHFRARTRHVALRRPSDFLVLAIERCGTVIGDVSLHLRTTADETRMAEIGWLQLTAERGHGYATEAAGAMLQLAFDDLRCCLVTAVIDRTNVDSARLALRLGFQAAGCTDQRQTFVLTSHAWRRRAVDSSAAAARSPG